MSNQVRELEKRVEALEQEVQLLNVQIKHTLLEIQERLLNGAYPALQSNDISQTTEQPLPIAAPTAPQKKTAGQSQISRIRLDEAGQVTQLEEPTVNPTPTPIAQPVPAAPKKAESLQSLETWMLKKVQEVGAARTRRLIEIYAQNGQLSASSARALEQLLKVYDEPLPEKPVRRPSAPAPIHEIPPLPEAIRRAVEYESPAPKSIRNKAVAMGTSSSRSPAAPRSAASKPQTIRATSTPVHAPDQPSNMVLRLIAGVQSAGIGITGRKSRG